MDAILLCMKKQGIRFFSRIKFTNTNIIRFHTKNNFLGLLRSRIDKYDNVLIMAHGSNDSIITPTHDLNRKWEKYITESDADAFSNNFVFAISCLTANKFGGKCVEAGALCYLGYQVEISSLFSVKKLEKSYIPKRVVLHFDTIIKHIFIEELSKAYEEFLTSPISVEVLKERFAFLLEQRIAELPNLSPQEYFEKYQIQLSDQNIKQFISVVTLQVLSLLNDITPRLICIGDPNYISSTFITYAKNDGLASELITERLLNNPFYRLIENEEYKSFLLKKAKF